MARKRAPGLTEREAEIMSILWDLGNGTVEDVRARMKNTPAASTVRTLMGIMVDRDLIADDGSSYSKQFHPRIDKPKAQASALRTLIDGLFAGSAEDLVLRLVDEGDVDLGQLRRLLRKSPQKRDR